MISIIIPTLNEESSIEKTLSSLKSGLSLPHELIVSDGKSKDKTIEIAQKIADKVVVYSGEKRQTIAMGRNDGAKAASGDYVVFLDADVTVFNPNNFFTRALAHFEKDPKLVGLMAELRVLPELESTADRLNWGFVNIIQRFANNVLGIGMATGEFQMIKKSVFMQLSGFNENLVAGEDQEFFRRLSRHGHTRYATDITVYHAGRRSRKIGWPKLWIEWMKNGIMVTFFKRSVSKEWEIIR